MCYDRNGIPKRAYDNYYEALEVKEYRESQGSESLYIYNCDICGKYHLTKNYKDIPREVTQWNQYIVS